MTARLAGAEALDYERAKTSYRCAVTDRAYSSEQ